MNSLGGLGVMCSSRDPKFAGSNTTKADGFFQDVKIPRRNPPGGTSSWGSGVWDFSLFKEPQAWKNSSTSVGFEPANLGSQGEHATPRPPRPTIRDLLACSGGSLYELHKMNNKIYKEYGISWLDISNSRPADTETWMVKNCNKYSDVRTNEKNKKSKQFVMKFSLYFIGISTSLCKFFTYVSI